jgi:hypothetical protein
MSLIFSTVVAAVAAETAEHHPDPVVPFIAAGIAFAVFLLLGIVTWSYRDVANRTTRGRDAAPHDGHAGH